MAALSWTLTSEFATAMNNEVQLSLNQTGGRQFPKDQYRASSKCWKICQGENTKYNGKIAKTISKAHCVHGSGFWEILWFNLSWNSYLLDSSVKLNPKLLAHDLLKRSKVPVKLRSHGIKLQLSFWSYWHQIYSTFGNFHTCMCQF